jgi:hypothetical protein
MANNFGSLLLQDYAIFYTILYSVAVRIPARKREVQNENNEVNESNDHLLSDFSIYLHMADILSIGCGER